MARIGVIKTKKDIWNLLITNFVREKMHFDVFGEKESFPAKQQSTGSPCNSRFLGEMEIRELRNHEFQGPPYLGLNIP